MSYYPMFLDLKEKRCVVIGGGNVALRKVNMLLDHSAKIEVVSTEFCEGLEALAKNDIIKVIRRSYETGDLEGMFIVIAATDNRETNERITAEANERGILINVVDTPDLCNFIVPSYVRRGDVTLAISTNGRSPALARKLRTELEKQFGEEYAQLAEVAAEVRSELKQKGIAVSSEKWQDALDLDGLLDLIRSGQKDKVRNRLWYDLGEAVD
ncbi:MAG: bifunctional precorrin-2 dehydrogenase/sirohydrochlorin ferrochelatase [Chloroflexi bacterium]|jgi:precorrin-2 dehydrogenase / sirohydrochlorin ferrochelatase|nr:bifunctional precorrin-2 dehydrogenase/sirohydrochlorin ferrochelatase [Chloroflexota bacterium]